jgi:hypothetical protein
MKKYARGLVGRWLVIRSEEMQTDWPVLARAAPDILVWPLPLCAMLGYIFPLPSIRVVYVALWTLDSGGCVREESARRAWEAWPFGKAVVSVLDAAHPDVQSPAYPDARALF